MNTGLVIDDLYRDLIIEHARQPRRRGSLAAPTHTAEGMNPVCGDEIALDVAIEAGAIREISFRGQGCSISQASASRPTDIVRGCPLDGATQCIEAMRAFMRTGTLPAGTDLGDLEALAGVAKFPARVKCALLCWNVLEQALRPALAHQAPAPSTERT
jgi:nitrogen fixation NifU-like protein